MATRLARCADAVVASSPQVCLLAAATLHSVTNRAAVRSERQELGGERTPPVFHHQRPHKRTQQDRGGLASRPVCSGSRQAQPGRPEQCPTGGERVQRPARCGRLFVRTCEFELAAQAGRRSQLPCRRRRCLPPPQPQVQRGVPRAWRSVTIPGTSLTLPAERHRHAAAVHPAPAAAAAPPPPAAAGHPLGCGSRHGPQLLRDLPAGAAAVPGAGGGWEWQALLRMRPRGRPHAATPAAATAALHPSQLNLHPPPDTQEWEAEDNEETHREVRHLLERVVRRCAKADPDFWPPGVTTAVLGSSGSSDTEPRTAASGDIWALLGLDGNAAAEAASASSGAAALQAADGGGAAASAIDADAAGQFAEQEAAQLLRFQSLADERAQQEAGGLRLATLPAAASQQAQRGAQVVVVSVPQCGCCCSRQAGKCSAAKQATCMALALSSILKLTQSRPHAACPLPQVTLNEALAHVASNVASLELPWSTLMAPPPGVVSQIAAPEHEMQPSKEGPAGQHALHAGRARASCLVAALTGMPPAPAVLAPRCM